MKKILLALFALAAAPLPSFAISATVNLVNSTGLAFSTAPVQNLLNFATSGGTASKLSAQITFSSATIAAETFTGGQASTASITVVSTQSLISAQATDTLVIPSTNSILGSPATGYITVIATTGLQGFQANFTTTISSFSTIQASSPSITLDGLNTFIYAGNWTSTDTLAHSLTTLANAINSGNTFTATTVAASSQVVITYIAYGSFPNGASVTTSSTALVSAGTWKGGANPVAITINNTFQNFVFTYGGNWASSDTVNHAATTLATAVNGIGDPFNNSVTGGIVAAAGGAVVASTAEYNGTFGNAFTMATSSSALVSVSSSNFSGGLNRSLLDQAFLINGTKYENGKHWSDSSNTSTGTIASIISFVNGVSTQTATCNSGINDLTAAWTAAQTITFTQAIACAGGNAMTLAVSAGSGMTVGSPTFTGGQDNASFNIGGVNFQYPIQWTLGASSTTTTTALSIAAAINANAIIKQFIISTNTANVVRATSTVNGLSQNYSLTSSTIALGVVGFTGGLNASWSSGTATIAVATQSFTLALPVLYTASAGGSITGLVAGTTYFAVPIDATDLQLASTSTGAVANVPIILRSTDTTTASHTFTLTPLGFTQGPASGGFQVSNDGINWANFTTTTFNVAISSTIFTPVNPSTTTVQDFGFVDYNYIRYNFTPPVQGGVALKVILTAKD